MTFRVMVVSFTSPMWRFTYLHIVVPDSDLLRNELGQRCVELGREAASWVRVFRLRDGASTPVHDV